MSLPPYSEKGVSVKLINGTDLNKSPEKIESGAVSYILASVQPPPKEAKRQPSDVVCIIDVSFSMDAEATIQSSTGASESHGLSLLDVAVHGVKTIVKTLGEYDRLAIVAFHDIATVELQLTRMDSGGQQSAEVLTRLRTRGGTNIWEGLRCGLDVLRLNPDHGSLGHLMLLTDGESPNYELIVPNLVEYKQQYERLPGTINTFGFGYQINSELLVNLAQSGSGSYSFIPDAGFVGTVFVNSISNLLVTMAREVYLTLQPENDAEFVDSGIMGGYPVEILPDSIRVNLGTLQHEQTKDIVVCMKNCSATETFLTARVQYETQSGREESQLAETDSKSVDMDVVELQRCRCLFVDVLERAVDVARRESCERALTLLSSAIDDVSNSRVKDSDTLQKLFEDMRGQSSEALSNSQWFQRWGRHYLPSVMFAHRLQQCNNFKDPGVQVYGGELFQELQDRADELFNQLPAPTSSRARTSVRSQPSIRSQPQSTPGRSLLNIFFTTCSAVPQADTSVLTGVNTTSAPISMATYNDRYAG